MSGVLSGVRVIEMAGLGPAPFCGMMLADHGADVIVVHRPDAPLNPQDPLARSRTTLAVDLKSPEGIRDVRALVAGADALIEGFRPGVMERLGLGPDVLIGDNPALVYGRMTGWGQTGPLASAPGHDINYLALTGALHASGRAGQKPTPAINLVGDFGGGGMMLAFGIVSGILSARTTGRGQVIDCAMTDGASLLMSMMWGFRAMGYWRDERGVNLLDTGAPFYDTFETSDGKYIALGAIEPQFYAELLRLAGVADDENFGRQMDARAWADMRVKFTEIFRTRTRDEWAGLENGPDACLAPVLSMTEAPAHPHNLHRAAFIESNGVIQPSPAPRFEATPARQPSPPRPLSDVR